MEAIRVAAQLLLPFSKLFEELRTKKGVYTSKHVNGGGWSLRNFEGSS
jgi:hypothetical protein